MVNIFTEPDPAVPRVNDVFKSAMIEPATVVTHRFIIPHTLDTHFQRGKQTSDEDVRFSPWTQNKNKQKSQTEKKNKCINAF